MATNGRFGHLGQYEVSENDPNEFPMPQNLGIDTKIKSLAYSEPKLQICPNLIGLRFSISPKVRLRRVLEYQRSRAAEDPALVLLF